MADNWQLKAVLSANAEGMIKALGDVGKIAKTTRKYLLDVGNSAGKLSGKIGLPFAALSGVLGGFSLMAVKNAVVGFTDMGEAVYKGALRSGMAVEEYQRMKYVADQSGVSIESLEGAMGKLNAQTAKAASGGNKNLAGLYQRLGVSMRDGNGEVRSAIDLLPQLADAFQRNKNPAVQARMGVALFGKAWGEMAPLLMEGSDGINQSLERFKRLKGVMNLDDIKGAKELGDKFKDLSFVTKGFQNTIAKELVPVLGPLIEDIVQWAAANRKVISSGVKEFVRELVDSVKSVDWTGVIQGAKDFGKALGWLVDFVGGTKNALIVLVLFMNAQTIMAFGALVSSVGRLIAGFIGMAGSALAPIAPLKLLQAEIAITSAKGGLLVGVLGKITAAAGIGAAAFAGWEIGGWINKNFVDGTKAGDMIGSGVAHTMAFFGNNDAKDAIATNNRPSLLGGNQVKASGQIEVSFKDAPPGMRVEQTKSGDVPINTDVGYRSYATGMGY